MQNNNKQCDLDTYPINIFYIFTLPSNTYWMNWKKKSSLAKNESEDVKDSGAT